MLGIKTNFQNWTSSWIQNFPPASESNTVQQPASGWAPSRARPRLLLSSADMSPKRNEWAQNLVWPDPLCYNYRQFKNVYCLIIDGKQKYFETWCTIIYTLYQSLYPFHFHFSLPNYWEFMKTLENLVSHFFEEWFSFKCISNAKNHV